VDDGGGGSLHALIDPSLSFKDAIDAVNCAARLNYLSRVLNQFEGNITAAARHAGIDRSNFRRLLRKYGVALG
jgi:two-component system response regulator AtoC